MIVKSCLGIMEKASNDTKGPAPEYAGGMKLEGPIPSVDTALGEILEVESSPELEKKVLLKIDLM